MTDQKPIGVFVRLPLSDCTKRRFYMDAAAGEDADKIMLAIGTPVQPGELASVSCGECGLPEMTPLFDAMLLLAARDAEIVRFRDALTEIAAVPDGAKYRETYSAFMHCVTVATEALKGGAA